MPSDSPNRSELAETRQLAVDAELDGQRIDKALAATFPDLSRSRIHGLIESGDVCLNGVVPKASAKVRSGDVLTLSVPAAIPSDLKPEKGDLKILFEDESLLVVSKAAGIVVHPGAGTNGGTLAAVLLEHCGTLSQIGGVTRPGIVHRLDKGTSGLLVVAKNDHAHRSLSAQFKARSVTKIYAAIAFGVPKPSRGSVRLPIGRDPGHRKRMAVVEDGREAWTDYETLELLGIASSLRLTLHSGRTHQIRVHMAALKCPLVGDNTYGAAPIASRAPGAVRDLVTGFDRPALHAHVLGFEHPTSGKALRFEEPWPEDMTRLRESLIKAQKKG
ncbi:MAG: RluA family pseudouridine synthase [Vicinamibacteria bacterium]